MDTLMKHWTQASTKDFAYSISLDFFTQLQDRFEQLEMDRKGFAEKLRRTRGRISQIFNAPPANPKIESLVQYARVLGMKVSIVAYDDGDPNNEKGPIFSEIFAKSWGKVGSPRDLEVFQGSDLTFDVQRMRSDFKPTFVTERKVGNLIVLEKGA